MKKVFILIVTILSIATAATAQKIGHINYSEIVISMPQYKSAMEELEKYTNDYRTQIEALEKEFNDKQLKYNNEASKMTVAQQELAQGELQSIYTRLQEFSNTATNNVSKKRDDLLKPIVENLNTAIKNFSTKNGYDYILDIEQIHFGKETNNVTNQIKAELGIK